MFGALAIPRIPPRARLRMDRSLFSSRPKLQMSGNDWAWFFVKLPFALLGLCLFLVLMYGIGSVGYSLTQVGSAPSSPPVTAQPATPASSAIDNASITWKDWEEKRPGMTAVQLEIAQHRWQEHHRAEVEAQQAH
ncbi:hypothetical protein [Hyphomicrobium sp.]|uniref:hypothetical protein n=1 Tax=Hyphomicrobium sp. TaxID=82 RepID=UPI001DC1773B|nr:hypothetical protein [Hyphomicrobium sp.]MBY0559853.1 hypothetical protein [Hyphomicrobium sp.]